VLKTQICVTRPQCVKEQIKHKGIIILNSTGLKSRPEPGTRHPKAM